MSRQQALFAVPPDGPRRIQRLRTKGWHAPRGTVYVGRPGRYGNPFIVATPKNGGNITPEAAVAEFRHALIEGRLQFSVSEVRRELAGRNLMCWCPLDQPCHADVLLELANGDRR
ncbi:DUF4326 domain-containing protein [Tsukamurella sputi]|uniref:DUF4326 domain-containing protein n=1 Tax=Tsukamurella sputi TaxID=2591848 RepID=A0A5C5RLW9_9ACTN|nr:DUF4326 domain-containing protein [Tsukamurella sputi]TWS23191.1 DUF4326 domain-containing protein [Tsukamurella sputi]